MLTYQITNESSANRLVPSGSRMHEIKRGATRDVLLEDSVAQTLRRGETRGDKLRVRHTCEAGEAVLAAAAEKRPRAAPRKPPAEPLGAFLAAPPARHGQPFADELAEAHGRPSAGGNGVAQATAGDEPPPPPAERPSAGHVLETLAEGDHAALLAAARAALGDRLPAGNVSRQRIVAELKRGMTDGL